MEMSPETCVLFSALELCDSQIGNGLKHFQGGDSNHDANETFQILVSTIDDIVNGLEFEHSMIKRDHWRFKLVSILTALALREEYPDDIDTDSDVYLVLSDFRSINFRLLFDLITKCHLDQALIQVLDVFDIKLKLELMRKCIDYLRTEMESKSSSTIALLEKMVRYVFLHKDGLLTVLSCTHDANTSTCEDNQPYCDVTTGYDVIEQLLMLMNHFFDDKGAVKRMKHVYVALFVGLLNVLSLAYMLPMFTYDTCATNHSAISFEMSKSKDQSRNVDEDKEGDGVNDESAANSNRGDVTNTVQYQIFHSKYGFTPEQYKDVMQHIFVDDVEKQMKRKRLPGEHLPVQFITDCLEMLSFMLNDSAIIHAVTLEFSFCKDTNNVVFAALDSWQTCCFMWAIFKKLHGNIETMHTVPTIKTYLKAKGKMDKIRTIQNSLLRSAWQDAAKSEKVTEHGIFCVAVVTVGEKLEGWETSFHWLLTECRSVHELTWFQCLEQNTDVLECLDNTVLLWKRLVEVTSKLKSGKSIQKIIQQLGKLFLDVFTKHNIHTQNELLKLVYECQAGNPDEIFAPKKTRIFAKLTVLLNRLVEVEQNVECGITNQIAVLALQCPETVLGSLVKHAIQNRKQCDIIVALLQKLNALVNFKASSNSPVAVIVESVRGILQQTGDMTEKEQANVLYFIMCLSSPLIEKHVDTVIDKLQTDVSKEKQHKDNQRSDICEIPLVHFTHIISHCLLPIIYDVTKFGEDSDLFYDVTSEFCLQVLDKILEKHRSAELQKGHSFNLVVLLQLTLELLACWEQEVSSDTIHLLCDYKLHIVNIVTSLQVLLTKNEHQRKRNELNWFNNKLRALPGHFKGYVVPLKCAMHLQVGCAESDVMDMQGLMLYLPASVQEFVYPSDMNLFDFSENMRDNNPWLSLLEVVATSDDVCAHICDMLKECTVIDATYELFVGALVEILSCAVDTEWVRVSKFTHKLLNKSATGSRVYQQKGEPVISECVAVSTMFNVAFILLESSNDLGEISHLLKAFTHALYYLLDDIDQSESSTSATNYACTNESGKDNHLLLIESGSTNSVKDNLKRDTEASSVDISLPISQKNESVKRELAHLRQMCVLVNHVPRDAQEALFGLLLDLVDRFSCSVKGQSPYWQKSARDDVVGKLRGVIEKTLSPEIQSIVDKKLEECNLV